MDKIKHFLSTNIRKVIYSEGATPLPWNIMLPVLLLMFFNSMAKTMVFSFLPKLVKSFNTSEVDTGYAVGWIGSAMFIGVILSSVLWGYLADKYGRKKLLIISASCTVVSLIAFGFTWNIEWAIATRFYLGISMGVIIIVKALISDVTDDTNSSLGMTFVLGGYSLGLIVGPVLGGFLAFPGELYPKTFPPDSIFNKFGPLLPTIVIALGFILAIISAIIYIPSDTKFYSKKKVTIDIENENQEKIEETNNEKIYLLQTNIKTDNNRITSYQLQITKSANQVPSKSKIRSYDNIVKNTKLGKIIMNKGSFRTCILYALYGFLGVGIDELFPLYAATSKDYAGFGFSTSEIGTALMVAAVFVLILQFTVMPRMTQYFGLRKSMRYCCFVITLVLPVIPAAYYIEHKVLFWLVMLSALIMLRFLVALAVLIINVMLNNVSDPELLGFVNGFAMTVYTIGRALSVPIIGSIFGWSLTNVKGATDNIDPLGFPLNQYFAFFVLSFFAILNTLFVYLLPESLDRKLIVTK